MKLPLPLDFGSMSTVHLLALPTGVKEHRMVFVTPDA